jgi:hypothetical protein
MRTSLLALGLLASGCTLGNLTPQARFSESAHTLTDASRWGHIDMALPHVSAKYSEQFLVRHANWGNALSIADAELVRLQLAADKKTAMTEVNVSWYPVGQISLHQSVITQQWERESGSYRLVSESVRAGDPNVFPAVPEDASVATSGG